MGQISSCTAFLDCGAGSRRQGEHELFPTAPLAPPQVEVVSSLNAGLLFSFHSHEIGVSPPGRYNFTFLSSDLELDLLSRRVK